MQQYISVGISFFLRAPRLTSPEVDWVVVFGLTSPKRTDERLPVDTSSVSSGFGREMKSAKAALKDRGRRGEKKKKRKLQAVSQTSVSSHKQWPQPGIHKFSQQSSYWRCTLCEDHEEDEVITSLHQLALRLNHLSVLEPGEDPRLQFTFLIFLTAKRFLPFYKLWTDFSSWHFSVLLLDQPHSSPSLVVDGGITSRWLIS